MKGGGNTRQKVTEYLKSFKRKQDQGGRVKEEKEEGREPVLLIGNCSVMDEENNNIL